MKHLFLLGCLAFTARLAVADPVFAPPPPSSPAPAGGEFASFSGKVVETTNTAGYTYVLVDTGGKKLWVAAAKFAVQPGDTVAVAAGIPMVNYHSQSMNRDFDVVYFTGGVVVNGVNPQAARPPCLPGIRP
jgi:hypothetical protein